MSNLLPTVRHFIVCEDIRRDPTVPRKVSLINLLSAINSVERPPFPFAVPRVVRLRAVNGVPRTSELKLDHRPPDTGQPVYKGPAKPWRVNLPRDPLEIVGLPFRIRDIRFPYPGLYEVELWYNGQAVGKESLLLR